MSCIQLWLYVYIVACACACACAWGDWSRRLEPVSGPRAFGRRLLNETGLRRVINGERAKVGDVPYLVSLRYGKVGKNVVWTAFCGGSLLQPRKAISAAHCFEQFDKEWCSRGHIKETYLKQVRAVMGSVTNEEPLNQPASPDSTQCRRLRNVWYPDTYYFPKDDIAVVMLKKPFELTAYVQTIQTAQAYENYAGTCLAAGFGRTDRDVVEPTKYMYMANLEIMPEAECSRLVRRNMRHFVCTCSETTDVAQGDSGGPLVCSGVSSDGKQVAQGILVGATSAGVSVPVSSIRLTLFTRVSSFRTYIRRAAAPPSPRTIPLFTIVAAVAVTRV